MIAIKTKTQTHLALVLSCLLLTTVSASSQTKQEIVAAWQQQVNSFQTLQFDYEGLLYDLTDPFGADALLVSKNKFAISGDKYYSYLKFSGAGDFSALAAAYNGEYYQKLTDEKIGVTVYRTKEEDTFEQPYLSPDPITTQYKFAFMPDAPRTIGILKKRETWEDLAQRITEIRPATRNGRQGTMVDIKIPQRRYIYKVFVDEKTLWPRHWSYVDSLRQDETKASGEVGEMDVNMVASIGEKDTALKFPSQIILRGLRNGRLMSEIYINTVPESLRINDLVPEDVFTLAPKDAKFIDADEQKKIFEERQKYAASHPVGLAQPTVRAGDSAPDFDVKDYNGNEWKLSDLKDKKIVVLTFFPKCFTGGCPNHLSSLRDHQGEFDRNNVQIIAVSVDPAEGEKGQKAFAKRWNLAFPLIPDTQRVLSKLYGAVQQDNELAAPMTFIIDKEGIVRFVDTNVNIQIHGADVLAKLHELGMI